MPSVLFICSRNSGKSQMAAALLRARSGGRVEGFSAGTKPASAIPEETRASLARLGVQLGDEAPKPIDPAVFSAVDKVVVIGYEAVVEPVPGMQGSIETWQLDEPSAHGIQGETRMDLIRDELDDRVVELLHELGVSPSSQCR
ncbi:MAG: low molecular weight phosphatase family protein [Propionibacteriaceae bacterium]|nr:low molecular weight phosphatase family protein [Propionibacteriaceae bacterium]